MRRLVLAALLAVAATTGAWAQDWGSLLKGVVSGVVGDKLTTEGSVMGTWRFAGPDCEFESDNLLAKAGGEAAARKIEEKLAPVYEKLGLDSCELTFADDSTFALRARGRETTGTFSFDGEEKTLTLRTRLGLSVTARVEVAGTTMRLQFKADRLMAALQALTSLVAKANATAETVNSLAANYDGLRLGLELTKESSERPGGGGWFNW